MSYRCTAKGASRTTAHGGLVSCKTDAPSSGSPYELNVDCFDLFGSCGWPEGVAQNGRSRTINREKLDRILLEAELRDPRSLRAEVFARYAGLLAPFETPWLAQGAMV